MTSEEFSDKIKSGNYPKELENAYNKTAEKEPEITNKLQKLSDGKDFELSGLDHRLKSQKTLKGSNKMEYGYFKLLNPKHKNRVARSNSKFEYSYYINGKWEFINLNDYFFDFALCYDEYEDITELEAMKLIKYWNEKEGVINAE